MDNLEVSRSETGVNEVERNERNTGRSTMPHGATTMFDLADQLKSLRDEKKKIEERLKHVNAIIDEVDGKLSEAMLISETQNFTRAGTMFCLTNTTRASAVAGQKDALFTALRGQGHGALVYETVNANSLSAFVKEQIEENSDVLPTWLDGLVSVFDKVTVGVRKATK